jgi:hypothetical protein
MRTQTRTHTRMRTAPMRRDIQHDEHAQDRLRPVGM